MAPLPKRKISKARGRRRRSHDALVPPTLSECPNCHGYKLAHHVCPSCGVYKTKTVVTPKTKSKQ